MNVALAQLNTTVGDLTGNEARILAAYRRGVEAGAEMVVCPELAITGYPPRDLLLKPHFVTQNVAVLERLAQATREVGLLVGFVGRTHGKPGRGLTNSVALLHHGRIAEVRTKMLLPTYDVFDEDRYFDAAEVNAPFTFKGRRMGVTICEDAWNDEDFWRDRRYRRNPVVELASAGAEMIFNVSASPWHVGKNRTREAMLASLAAKTNCPLLYCNLVGGNDELVFDGASMAFDGQGRLTAQGALFEEDFLLLDTDKLQPVAPCPGGG